MLTMSDVADLLTALNVRCSAGPLGVTFSWYFDSGNLDRHGRHRYRVESGSGVAGRGHSWNVVELPDGTPRGPKVTTRSALRRQVLETLAEGPRPDPREGREAYARRHTTRSTSSVQWFTRRRSTARVHPVIDASPPEPE
jgi:hypothetical protein